MQFLKLRQMHKIKAHITQLPGQHLRGIKNTIAVASGKGGVGKSTIAVNLAIALAQTGAQVGLLDADIYGPSIPSMLGHLQKAEIVDDKYLPIFKHGIHAMSIGYLSANETALIWRGPMLAKALIHILDTTNWGELDYLIIDLPPGTGDIQLSLVQKIPLTAAIIVTTPQNIATMDAQKAINMFEKTNIKVLGIVENMTHHICSNCGSIEHIFGQDGAQNLSQQFDLPLLGGIPLKNSIRDNCDKGVASLDAFVDLAANVNMSISKLPLRL
jgi:ATP-binding protein involved in chromosome partitioning